MSGSVAAAGSIDVVRIVQEIRDSVARKQADRIGGTEVELDQALAARLRAWACEVAIETALHRRLLQPGDSWNLAPDYLIRPRQPGLRGRMIALAKRLVRPWVRLYTDQLLNRQAQLNLYVVHVLRETVAEMVRMEAELRCLRERCETLERTAGTFSRPEGNLR